MIGNNSLEPFLFRHMRNACTLVEHVRFVPYICTKQYLFLYTREGPSSQRSMKKKINSLVHSDTIIKGRPSRDQRATAQQRSCPVNPISVATYLKSQGLTIASQLSNEEHSSSFINTLSTITYYTLGSGKWSPPGHAGSQHLGRTW